MAAPSRSRRSKRCSRQRRHTPRRSGQPSLYRELPRCTPAPQPCHDPAVVAQLQKADKVADAALDAAENAVRTPGFGDSVVRTAVATAQEALSAFTAIVATVRSK